MAEDQKSIDGIIEKLAMITDATQTLFPNGKSAIVLELPFDDFKKVQSNFRQIDQEFKQFKIDGLSIRRKIVKINIFARISSGKRIKCISFYVAFRKLKGRRGFEC